MRTPKDPSTEDKSIPSHSTSRNVGKRDTFFGTADTERETSLQKDTVTTSLKHIAHPGLGCWVWGSSLRL